MACKNSFVVNETANNKGKDYFRETSSSDTSGYLKYMKKILKIIYVFGCEYCIKLDLPCQAFMHKTYSLLNFPFLISKKVGGKSTIELDI